MAAPMSWGRIKYSVCTPTLSSIFSRLSDRLFRTHDRRRGSSVFLLAPLLAETQPVPLASSLPPSSAGTEGLHSRFRWMADHVPAFRVSGGHIRVLHTPDEFYQTMKARIKVAKKRVVLASLYLGTGPLEQDLVDCMHEALERSRSKGVTSDLQVSILLDYTRGSRGKKNSRTMLLPLLRRFQDQVHVSLYHTPDLRGLLRLLIPERFNETIGVQHIKVYLFDDSLIISGANLSDSYFSNRQDRYMLLENCGEIADFFAELVGAVGSVSLQLEPDDSVRMEEGVVHPYRGDRAQFSAVAQQRIMEVVNAARARTCAERPGESGTGSLPPASGPGAGDADTWVFPLVQMKPLGVHLDEEVTRRLLTEAGSDSTVYLTSGYFNLTRAYMRLVLGAGADYQILMASPEVNGFFGAQGVAGAIPAAYVHLARQFYSAVCRRGQQQRVQLHEYHRRDWTFHAKGTGNALPEVHPSVQLYLQATQPPCQALGEAGHSTHQELLLRGLQASGAAQNQVGHVTTMPSADDVKSGSCSDVGF